MQLKNKLCTLVVEERFEYSACRFYVETFVNGCRYLAALLKMAILKMCSVMAAIEEEAIVVASMLEEGLVASLQKALSSVAMRMVQESLSFSASAVVGVSLF
jgi:hypothetical protein